MRSLLFFKSKLAAWLVGMTAMVAVPVVGAVAIAYTILPDIGVFSRGQKVIIWTYGILCLLIIIYAFAATWAFLNEIWCEYLPAYKRMKYYIGLIILPVIGSFFVLYLYLKPSFKLGGVVKRFSAVLVGSTIIDVVILTVVFFAEAGLEWVLLIAGIMGVFHYILLIIISCKLAKNAIGRSAKIIIAVLLSSLFGAFGFMASSKWIIDSKIAKIKKELADTYGHPLTAEALKSLYYHGLKPNYEKFEKILPRDPEDEENLILLCDFPSELECYYAASFLDSEKLRVKLNQWIKSKKAFFEDFDRIIDNEQYLKMPESFRNYDGLLIAILLPELSKLRHWARLDRARIIDALNHGNLNHALRLFAQMKKISSYAEDDPFIISILVGMAVETIRLSALRNIIEKGDLTDKRIYELINELEAEQAKWKQLYTDAMYGEAVCFIDTLERTIDDMDMEFIKLDRELAAKYFKPNRKIRKFLTIPFCWMLARDFLYGLELYNIQSQEVPPSDITFKKMMGNMPDYVIFSRMMPPWGCLLWNKIEMIRSQHAAAITALRIELYRRKYKKLPEKLSDLVPEFAPVLPIDSFGGKPLKYIHGEITLPFVDARVKYSESADLVPIRVNGYCVYSVGPDKKDDNGWRAEIKNEYYDDIGFSVIRKVFNK